MSNGLSERLDAMELRVEWLEVRARVAWWFWLAIIACCSVSLSLNAVRLLEWQ